MSQQAAKVIKKAGRKKPLPINPVGWTTIRVREHIPTLIEAVRTVFQEDHQKFVSPSDVLTDSLKLYKEKLRPTA